MSYLPNNTRSTVAARIQAFRHVQTLEDHSSHLTKAPQALSQTTESGTTNGRGHRKDASFAPPAERVSRDGAEGVRGGGRPPIGALNHKPHASMEEKNTDKHALWATSGRPSTGLAPRPTMRDEPFESSFLARSPRHHRSMENMATEESELTNARSRLKSIAKKKEIPENRPPDRALTIADLGDMIDSALEQQDDSSTELASESLSGLVTPKTTAVRHGRSARAARKSIDEHTETEVQHAPPQHDGVAKNRWHPEEHARHEPRGRSLAPSQLDIIRNTSPVKQRAAMFEQLQKKEDITLAAEPPHDRQNHEQKTWKTIPEYEPTPEIDQDVRRAKFGQDIYERPQSTLAAPNPPVKVEHRQEPGSTGRGTLETFKTARHSLGKGDHREGTQSTGYVTMEVPGRKGSMSWLSRWGMFSKGNSAPPEATDDNATAKPGNNGHYSEARPSVVQSRVQDLLSAAAKNETDEQKRRESEIEQLRRRPTSYQGKVIETEVKEKVPGPASMQPHQIPPSQLPIQEEAAVLEPLGPTLDGKEEGVKIKNVRNQDTLTSSTPVHRSWNEKEVLDSSTPWDAIKMHSRPDSTRSVSPEKGSPTKTGPSTPRRGRALRASVAPRESGYAMEQAFIISPGRSRSQSRASGSRMLVEVEVRDSPGQLARDMGQKIVFVRADVDEIEEDDEDGS